MKKSDKSDTHFSALTMPTIWFYIRKNTIRRLSSSTILKFIPMSTKRSCAGAISQAWEGGLTFAPDGGMPIECLNHTGIDGLST